jgi:hypothetical protein
MLPLAFLLFLLHTLSPCEATLHPIIGILTVPTYQQWEGEPVGSGSVDLGPNADVYNCYVPAGYVKLVEGGMARASLLPCTGPWESFVSAVASVNGFLFTGMFTDYQADNGTLTEYGRRGKYIIDHVFQQNKLGVWLPLFAECKGFNMLTFFVSGVPYWRNLIRDDINALDLAAPIIFNSDMDYQNTKFYQSAASTHSADLLVSGPNLMNRHPYGILPSNYSSNPNLTSTFGPYVATTIDANGVEFVSVIEHPLYPIYGAATHPEKVIFEWRDTITTPHTDESIHANLWFGKLLGNDARKNDRSFPTAEEESATLSYANLVADTRSFMGGEFQQTYFLVPKSDGSRTVCVSLVSFMLASLSLLLM